MAFTRTYPMANNRSYRPGDNPLLAQKATLTSGSNIINNVRTDFVTTMTTAPWAATDWFVVIRTATNNADVGSYRATVAAANAITIMKMDGTPFTATDNGECSIIIFNKNTPSGNDRIPESILVTAAGGSNFTGITADGQYFEIDPASFSPMAIYNISIAKIINTGGMTGYLLGTTGFNGSPLC